MSTPAEPAVPAPAPPGTRPAHIEQPARGAPGIPGLIGTVAGIVLGVVLVIAGSGTSSALAGIGIALIVIGLLLSPGFVVVAPNESCVLILFGRYIGTLRQAGLWWVNPFTKLSRVTISLRVRTFQSERIKVNDANGNPIEIAAVVVWQVTDTAKAVFDVDNFLQFVEVQSETALRHLANQYRYDDYEDGAVSLRGNSDEVRAGLEAELQTRLHLAGIEILETRLTHLAYAPEIAEVMLRRQQAEAILAARRTMVHGAVSLVQMALAQLADSDLVELDSERKATMVSNLMIVLSGDRAPTPVINTGTLYG